MKLKVTLGLALLMIAGSLLQGCATPHFAAKTPSGRLGFLDRVSHWESAHASHASHASKKKNKFSFLAPTDESVKEEDSAGDAPGAVALSASEMNLTGVGGLKWPLHSVAVTSEFGKRNGEFHEGVDLKAQKGTPIYAAQSGRVLYADSRIRGYGKMVVIQHVKSLATVYAHISKLLVRRGQRVIQGQKIALSGQTGRARGPHLHFETRRGLAAINPLKMLPITRSVQQLAANR